ncbi:MAG: hypothetical protein A2445_05705 [Candidatus Jacksonbacteria bacterium RIFOXYC2_FULL_44_29]|nr:MAG: hypothetical protein A2240_05550 [Candidatus Jacksonbacteria bacterium RIFOXYA2_FULL_43_12]OGY79180.1 MAG: hypothetical protein A2445_05705 [Candidatus Jacksonbacteria bacterium RIFOXYC2_FULL_44_29]OGY82101.1 MAG: hypothetical protein A2550_00175 [Candidatus Jacksonbacteria bacterium RIFOXYD2_FULL_43_21]HCC50214.1 hypothetical protein [Candidatus Jacksonbacteria bacterium]
MVIYFKKVIDMALSNSVSVIAEEPEYLIINKPAGLLVHPTQAGGEVTLIDWLIEHYPEVKKVGDEPQLRPGIVHRLDRAVSGVMVIARTGEMFNWLKQQFVDRKVLKEYLALVYDPIKRSEGEISLPIQKGKVKTKVMPRGSENEATRIKTAVTFFEVFQLFQHYTLLKVRINTGRTHQIRAHLSFYGHSVVGDRKYCHPRYINRTAFTKFIKFDRVFLHASTIGFFDCTSKWRQYQADLPAELTDFLKTLSG